MFIPLCQKCSSINVLEGQFESVTGRLLKMFGFQPFLCKNCGFRWNQLLVVNLLLNTIYMLLIAEICFLLWNFT